MIVISSRIFNFLLKLIISAFQHIPFPLLWPYGALTCTLSAYERSNLNYLKHLHNALYIHKSVRFLAGYTPVFSTITRESIRSQPEPLSWQIVVSPCSDRRCRCRSSVLQLCCSEPDSSSSLTSDIPPYQESEF